MKRRFGSDPQILGRVLRLNSENHTIIGVLPASFEAPLVWGPAEVIRPFTIYSDFPTTRNGGWVSLLGQLKPGASRKQAQSEVATIAARLAHDFPK